MAILVAVSTLSFIGVGAFVGVRLLLLWRRTRMLPELSIGLGLVLVAMVGYPLSVGAILPGVDPAVARTCFALGTAAMGAGSISIYVFTWQVFRPGVVWANVASAAAIGGLALLAIATAAVAGTSPLTPDGRVPDPGLVPRQLIVGFSYVWTAIESFRYQAMLRKRAVLGLAEPGLANRFLLWGLAGVFASAGIGISTWIALSGVDPTGHPVSMLAIGTAGFVTSIALYLAFVPPAAYRRWIEGPGATSAA